MQKNSTVASPFISLITVSVLLALFVIPVQAQIPIPQQEGALPVPAWIGSPATPKPISSPPIPINSYMGRSGWSNTHNDPYMTDTYFSGGPLGTDGMEVFSAYLGSETEELADCVTITFDSEGHLVTACPGRVEVPLYLLDPTTLKTLAKFDLPTKKGGTDISGSGYFYIDHEDRAIVPTGRQIWVISHDHTAFHLDSIYELEAYIPAEDGIASSLPDYEGRLWFVAKSGVVGAIDRARYPEPGSVNIQILEGEKIENSFSMDETGGVFVVTDHAMYRFDAGANGEPVITWRESYDRGTQLKPGQYSMGSGTTPTLMGTEYVAITDNAEPQMQVVVYRRAKVVEGPRLVCAVPVFEPGRSATENSLIATDRSIIVENNYGYSSAYVTSEGKTTEPGMARIDLDENGGHVVWTSSEHIPSVVSKMSLANGLIYTYSKDPGPEQTDAWYFTVIDFETGATVYKQLAGTGMGYNNHYASIYLSPDGKTAYVGTLFGIAAMRDKSGPSGWTEAWSHLDKTERN
ncbi:MAG: hypothetical protein RBU29_05965 [bacterium]|jgi:hypothetical protein|nr:hypothetical protein [bacterium]